MVTFTPMIILYQISNHSDSIQLERNVKHLINEYNENHVHNINSACVFGGFDGEWIMNQMESHTHLHDSNQIVNSIHRFDVDLKNAIRWLYRHTEPLPPIRTTSLLDYVYDGITHHFECMLQNHQNDSNDDYLMIVPPLLLNQLVDVCKQAMQILKISILNQDESVLSANWPIPFQNQLKRNDKTREDLICKLVNLPNFEMEWNWNQVQQNPNQILNKMLRACVDYLYVIGEHHDVRYDALRIDSNGELILPNDLLPVAISIKNLLINYLSHWRSAHEPSKTLITSYLIFDVILKHHIDLQWSEMIKLEIDFVNNIYYYNKQWMGRQKKARIEMQNLLTDPMLWLTDYVQKKVDLYVPGSPSPIRPSVVSSSVISNIVSSPATTLSPATKKRQRQEPMREELKQQSAKKQRLPGIEYTPKMAPPRQQMVTPRVILSVKKSVQPTPPSKFKLPGIAYTPAVAKTIQRKQELDEDLRRLEEYNKRLLDVMDSEPQDDFTFNEGQDEVDHLYNNEENEDERSALEEETRAALEISFNFSF
ncbi:hypothetical protein AKO1_010690 [Acrasis kona]|uniref:Uncharacterized protein n=1 Tax=Acrasis kona TaxID=1008807 RepID=A0AAW2ZJ13_9EUKA